MSIINKGSIDAKQIRLELEDELEDINHEIISLESTKDNIIKIIIQKKNIRIKSTSNESSYHNHLDKKWYIYWTSGKDLDKAYKDGQSFYCNIRKPTKSDFETDFLYDFEDYAYKLYRYNCFLYKRVYYIYFGENFTYYAQVDLENFIKTNVIFNFNTPSFRKVDPYTYKPKILICGKEFDLSQTFFSRYLLELGIKSKILEWFKKIKISKDYSNKTFLPKTVEFFKYQDEYVYHEPDVGQIYLVKKRNEPDDISDIKIQLNIKHEYYFWAVEYIKHNFEKLYNLGVNAFKFMINFGEMNLFKYTEFFPDIESNDTYFEKYQMNTVEYKRELLNQPNIVIFLKQNIKENHGSFGKILSKLIQMFPDSLDLSNGIPRFNIKASNNIFFSLGGHNQTKFSRNLLKDRQIPYEYQQIIKIKDNVTIEQCNILNEYSLEISGHNVLKEENGKILENNINSYKLLLTPPYRSFYQLFSDPILFSNYEYDKFMNINDYLEQNNITDPSNWVNVGGSIKNKYLKYKNKYLNLKYGGSNYAEQKEIESMNEIPDITYLGNNIKSLIKLKVNVMNFPIEKELAWTNNLTDDLHKTVSFDKKIKCNHIKYLDFDYEKKFYKYNCIYIKYGYKIEFKSQEEIINFYKDNVILTINTPEYNNYIPYTFNLSIQILGQTYNINNIYLSFNFTKYVYEHVLKWVTDKTTNLSYLNCSYGLNLNYQQIYLLNGNLDYDEESHLKISTIKLQMTIKYEYLFWIIEKIINNLELLLSLDLNSYKFNFFGGNCKLEHIQEFFPDHIDGEKFNTYKIGEKEYKRELFLGPTIVFYINERISNENLAKLIDTLVNMFPDTLELSDGHPRFNIRLSKNLFISVGGNNQFKFGRHKFREVTIPEEYKNIIKKENYEKYTEEECNRINIQTKNLSDHHLLKFENGKCIPNNIISYFIITSPYSSFEELFTELNLLKYYKNIS
jgi:hypothetical protein